MGFDYDVIIKNWNGKYVLLKKMGVFGLGVLLISLIFKSVCLLMNEKFIKMILIENVIEVLFIILYFMVWCCINIVYIDIGWLILLKLWVWRISIDVLILICWIFYKDNFNSVVWFIY